MSLSIYAQTLTPFLHLFKYRPTHELMAKIKYMKEYRMK